MDELSSFFGSDEIPNSVESPPLIPYQQPPWKKKYNRRNFNLSTHSLNKSDITRDSLDPAFNPDTFRLSPVGITLSNGFSGTSNLPLAFPPEAEEGNIEYKLKLIAPDEDRLEHLVTQMKWRLDEGGGQAIYRLGVDDNGAVTGLSASEMTASITTVHQMAQRLSANLSLLRECTVTMPDMAIEEDCNFSVPSRLRKAIELDVRRKLPVNEGLPDLCIAMLGSMDVGKSTLLGILTDGELDNGRGRARLNLFRHLHEVQSGRTSSLVSELIGFDATGRLINRRQSHGKLNKRTVDEVVRDSNRLITLLDLAGHPKYQRTTLSGLAQNSPSFALLVVSATGGLTPEGLDHARTAAALSIPIAVVISKLDLIQNEQTCIAEVKADILEKLRNITFYQLSDHQVMPPNSIQCFNSDPPVFALSSVTGEGLDKLLVYLSHLSTTSFRKFGSLIVPPLGAPDAPSHICTNVVLEGKEVSLAPEVEIWVTRVFWQVPGVKNPVLEGLVKFGQVRDNQRLWLGPAEDGQFAPVRVLELRRNRQPYSILHTGQMGSLVCVLEDEGDQNKIPQFNLSSVRRGMVMLSALPQPESSPSLGSVCWSFGVSRLTWLPCGRLPNLSSGYLPPINATIGVYSGNVCQHAKVIESKVVNNPFTDLLNLDTCVDTALFQFDKNRLVVQFLCQPEYLACGRRVILSFDQGVKAVGFIDDLSNILTRPQSVPSPPRSLWKSVSNTQLASATVDSLDDLLRQVGIDSQGTKFITEHCDKMAADISTPPADMSQIVGSRQYRRKKRRRKLALQATPSLLKFKQEEEARDNVYEQSSSTSTWNSSNGEPSQSLGFLVAEKLDGCNFLSALPLEPSSGILAPTDNSTIPTNNKKPVTKNRKRRHRRSKK